MGLFIEPSCLENGTGQSTQDRLSTNWTVEEGLEDDLVGRAQVLEVQQGLNITHNVSCLFAPKSSRDDSS